MTTTSAPRTENIRQIRDMMETVKPADLTDDELATMVEILRCASDRKHESCVVYLDLVRPGRSPLSWGSNGLPRRATQAEWRDDCLVTLTN
jgi:hypothetical protein